MPKEPIATTKAGSAAGLAEAEDWTRLFAAHGWLVLCANSDAVDLDALERTCPPDTLFVFFNKTYKILDRPFRRPCVLVARSSRAGANIVHRREVEKVVAPLLGPGFLGLCNLKAGGAERFSPAADFGGAPVGHLDLTQRLAGFYPASHVPTSGFALALFLAETCPETRIELAGFTARRSRQWKLFADHDWTFEQIVLRLLEAEGRIRRSEPADDALRRIRERFPGASPETVGLVAAEVLSERLEGANLAIDRLISVVRPLERGSDLLRRFKPKTRKARLAERDAAEAEAGKGG